MELSSVVNNVSTIVMLANKDIFNNWTKCYMCGDYCLMNKWTHLDKYAMLLSKEIFDTLRHAKVFNILGCDLVIINCH